MKTAIYILFSILMISSCNANSKQIDFRDGDIIFHTSKSRQSKAIQLATHSTLSHMGLIVTIDNEKYVLEAVQPVKLTKLNDWIERGVDKKYIVKRLKKADSLLTPAVIKDLKDYGQSLIGKDYDKCFEWSDDKIYCSELVFKIYKKTLNIEIGQLQRLKDFDLTDKSVKQIMKERYGNKIPTNEVVISPVSMFNSDLLITIYSN
jgi:uncharacterized protein YycO